MEAVDAVRQQETRFGQFPLRRHPRSVRKSFLVFAQPKRRCSDRDVWWSPSSANIKSIGGEPGAS
jgi:hypothetical protein